MKIISKIKSKLYRLGIPFKVFLLRRKPCINVQFVFSNVSFWKNDSLFLKMKSHKRFRPYIVIVPDLMVHEDSKSAILSCEKYLLSKKYEFYNPFSIEQDKIAVSKIKPDIIFYPRPYNAYPRGYRFEDNYNALFCHSDYGFHTVDNPFIVDTIYINHVWQNYFENDELKQEVIFKYPNLKKSITVTGLPNADSFLGSNTSPWKSCNEAKFKIIWAPHFSITPGWLDYSNFIDLSGEMLKLMKNSSYNIQWAFKPHPLLKNSLYEHPLWGPQKTDDYYLEWSHSRNSQLEEGEYIDLFMTSDAIIHDCSSFRVEYLHTGKPSLFLSKDKGNFKDNLFKVGHEALKCHYIGQTIEDIKRFICDVVINKNDPKKEDRINYFQKYLLPPNGKSASENIINAILGE